jgi:ribosomal protein L16 Arg81 hydroxylase
VNSSHAPQIGPELTMMSRQTSGQQQQGGAGTLNNNNSDGSHPQPEHLPGTSTTSNVENKPIESLVLQSILLTSHRSTCEEFFERIWQNQPYLMKKNVFQKEDGSCAIGGQAFPRPPIEASTGGNGVWRDDKMKTTPWDEMVYQGWTILSSILETASSGSVGTTTTTMQGPHDDDEVPLVLRNLEVLPREDILALYGTSLFSSYLDGCSIVLNHADLLSPYIAALCEDLQHSFPHAYANSYLTPPNSQTVPPHADDRDVLIFQLVGSKDWQVYETIPVVYPYPHEQVGKGGVPVPPEVLDGPVTLSVRLEPGDVLYMPRGMVHQARSTPDCPSFHITVALATHDWTLAGNLGRAIQRRLTTVVDYRRSLLPMTSIATAAASPVDMLQKKIDAILEGIRQEITATSILSDISERIESHNRRAFTRRASSIHKARIEAMDQYDNGSNSSNSSSATTSDNERNVRQVRQRKSNYSKKEVDHHPSDSVMDCIVGPIAAKTVTYRTMIRAATVEERAYAQNKLMTSSSPPSTSCGGIGMMHPPTTSTNTTPQQQQQQQQQHQPPRGLNVREEIGDSIMEIISKVKADATQSYSVVELKRLMVGHYTVLVCDLSLLCLTKRAVELGAFAIDRITNTNIITNDGNDDNNKVRTET